MCESLQHRSSHRFYLFKFFCSLTFLLHLSFSMLKITAFLLHLNALSKLLITHHSLTLLSEFLQSIKHSPPVTSCCEVCVCVGVCVSEMYLQSGETPVVHKKASWFPLSSVPSPLFRSLLQFSKSWCWTLTVNM